MSQPLIIHTDGGSRGNPGPAAAGFWIPSLQTGGNRYLPHRTNNEAEYEGVILALEHALEHGFVDVFIKSDSKLIVNQIAGTWGIKFPHLQALKDKVDSLIERLSSFAIDYVPRAQNAEADRECNECMDRVENELNGDATGFFS